MRDIVGNNGSATTVTAKTKYRDYMDFLGRSNSNVSTNKREPANKDGVPGHGRGVSGITYKMTHGVDDAQRVYPNLERNGSTRLTKVSYCSYTEFLDSYKTQKYSPVKPALPEKPKLKSEIYVEVNNGRVQNKAILNSRSTAKSPPQKRTETTNGVNGTPVIEELRRTFSANGQTKPVNGSSPQKQRPQIDDHDGRPLVSSHDVNSKTKKHVHFTSATLPRLANGKSTYHPSENFSVNPPANAHIRGILSPSAKLAVTTPSTQTLPRPNNSGQLSKKPTPPPKYLPSYQRVQLQRAHSYGSEKTVPAPPKPPPAPQKELQVRKMETSVTPVVERNGRELKNDPNVKKLVYNTYRSLLGAYNGKANEMISTLPRGMVRQDQGVQRQLESIASQGGLDKLNGRIHPDHLENENQ